MWQQTIFLWWQQFWIWAAEYFIFLLVAAVVWGYWRDRKPHWLIVWLSTSISYAVTSIIKQVFYIPRPYLTEAAGSWLLHPPINGSFPSGHATVAFALAAGLGRWDKNRRLWYYILAGIIAVSRVMVNVHRWQDIIAGAGLALAMDWIVIKLGYRWSVFRRLIDN